MVHHREAKQLARREIGSFFWGKVTSRHDRPKRTSSCSLVSPKKSQNDRSRSSQIFATQSMTRLRLLTVNVIQTRSCVPHSTGTGRGQRRTTRQEGWKADGAGDCSPRSPAADSSASPAGPLALPVCDIAYALAGSRAPHQPTPPPCPPAWPSPAHSASPPASTW